MTSLRGRKLLPIAAGLVAVGSVALLALSWREIAVRYHLSRLRRDPAAARLVLDELRAARPPGFRDGLTIPLALPARDPRSEALRRLLDHEDGTRLLLQAISPESSGGAHSCVVHLSLLRPIIGRVLYGLLTPAFGAAWRSSFPRAAVVDGGCAVSSDSPREVLTLSCAECDRAFEAWLRAR